MGANYLCVCPLRFEYLNPVAFGDGKRLLEFGPAAAGMMFGLAMLLTEERGLSLGAGTGDLRSLSRLIGGWAGLPIVLVNDSGGYWRRLQAGANEFTDISELVLEVLCEDPFAMKALVARQSPHVAEETREPRANVTHWRPCPQPPKGSDNGE